MNQTVAGATGKLFMCWNNTYRLVPDPLPTAATDEDRALEVQQTTWADGSQNKTIFFKNGTVAVFNQSNQAFLSYIQRPQYLYSPSTVTNDTNGDERTTFANGTVFIKRAPLVSTATLYQKATAEQWFRNYSNGTTETKFLNGTQIISVKNSSTGVENITYIKKVEGNINVQVNNTIAIAFANNT